MSIKAIVFDKDGTLVDYPAYWYPVASRATERAYAILGVAPDKIMQDEIIDHVRELGTTESGVDINGALPRGDYAGIIAVLARRAAALGATFTAEECVDAFSRGYAAKETKACGRVVPTTPLLDKTLRKLKARGILVRHFKDEKIKEYNRITIGTDAEMDAFLSAVDLILGE